MSYFTTFELPEGAGFHLVAGRPHGLQRLLVASGRIPAANPGRNRMHLHLGDEVIRVLDGELVIRVGDERRTCRAGDVAVIPPNTLHGLRPVTDVLMEVVAEHDIGTFYPVRQPDGTRRLVEIHTRSPWNAPPPQPGAYTTEEEVQRLLAAVDLEV